MKIYSFLLIVFVSSIESTPAGFHPIALVVKGSTASSDQFRFLAALRVHNEIKCGASIISNRWLITAAHCIKSNMENFNYGPADLQLLIGTHELNQGGVTYNVEKVNVHENFDDFISFENDIALLKVDRDIELNDKISQIPLEMEDVAVGSEVFSAGWGQTTVNPGPASNSLQFLSMITINTQTCKNHYVSLGENVFDSNICAQPTGGQGTCQGDSGGPLMRNGKLIGILSWGLICGGRDPEVYTRISAFQSWIDSHMDEEYQI